MKHELRYRDFSDLYDKLNTERIPKISSEIPQCSRSQKVQAPLQRIFETYIACYLTFITQYARASDGDGKRKHNVSGRNTDRTRS